MSGPLRTVVVVGASLAGLRAVETLRRRGFDGRLVLIGDERHEPYDRPPLSKELLRGEWGPERIALRRDGLDELSLDLRLGRRARALDLDAREVRLEGGERVAFDGLVLATGARARPLPGAPRLEGVHLLRTLDDALALRDALDSGPRVAVVGAGFIGAEVASSCRKRGLDVTVIEALEIPLARAIGPEMGAVCASLHGDHGVELRVGAPVAGLEGTGRVGAVRLEDGSRVAADLVVVGIGVAPATDWLEGSGLELADGVVCDETCATRAPGVVAAGDVARWTNPLFGECMRVEHWTHAVEQAAAAAGRLLDGEATEPFAPAPLFWSDQYDVKIQFAGHHRPGDRVEVVHGRPEERRFVALYGRGERLVGALAMNRPRQLVAWRRRVREGASWEDALAEARASGA